MKAWHDLLKRIRDNGETRSDRTGVGTTSIFGECIKVHNSGTFPAVTTKRLFFKQCMAELACFIRGDHSLDAFHLAGCTIWDGNGNDPRWTESDGCKFAGDLGRIYGVQWRDWKGFDGVPSDQLRALVQGINQDPTSRRHIVTAWNPGELDQMCLPPCHMMFQCRVSKGKALDMAVYMRSCDVFLGLPFNIASYAALQRLIAYETGFDSGDLTFFLGDAHIYNNHQDQVAEVLSRKPYRQPYLEGHKGVSISLWDFGPSDFTLKDYVTHPAVRAPLNV